LKKFEFVDPCLLRYAVFDKQNTCQRNLTWKKFLVRRFGDVIWFYVDKMFSDKAGNEKNIVKTTTRFGMLHLNFEIIEPF
jgi:hypothetical protein